MLTAAATTPLRDLSTTFYRAVARQFRAAAPLPPRHLGKAISIRLTLPADNLPPSCRSLASRPERWEALPCPTIAEIPANIRHGLSDSSPPAVQVLAPLHGTGVSCSG